jgi:hypothetical protein
MSRGRISGQVGDRDARDRALLASGRSMLSGCGSPMPDGWRWPDDGRWGLPAAQDAQHADSKAAGHFPARRGLGRISEAASDLGAVRPLATGGSIGSRARRSRAIGERSVTEDDQRWRHELERQDQQRAQSRNGCTPSGGPERWRWHGSGQGSALSTASWWHRPRQPIGRLGERR